jgi:beta-mannosidase
MKRTALSEGWRFSLAPEEVGHHRPQLQPVGWMPAQVPGGVHLDLVENGVIAHPFSRRYEIGAQWVDEAAWIYETAFEWAPSGDLARRVLVFEGLDTIASIKLNDVELGRVDNMHVPSEFDVTEALVAGRNVLQIRFESAVRTGGARRRKWFDDQGKPQDFVHFDERAFVRKPGYMSGWDWGPRLVGAGIFRDVFLLEYANRITDLEVRIEPGDDGIYMVAVRAATEFPEDVTLSIELGAGASLMANGEGSGTAEWFVKGGLWWPRGMGSQTLHKVIASLPSGDRVEKQIGLRTIRLVREPDAHGESFEFQVNGRPFWARGANWIPNDSFPGQIRDKEIRDQVERFAALNMNMLRVWGGGFYESEEFYDACDAQGVLVWQDFSYACMYYPDDLRWQEVARKEASFQVRRLRHRASLALWCGNNENLVMWQSKWGGVGQQPDRYYGSNIYDIVLPKVVSELDPAVYTL